MGKNILTILFTVASASFVNAQSWLTLGSGIGYNNYYYNSVNALASYNGELYAAGYFDVAGGVAANNIAKWNGTNWSAVETGVDGDIQDLCVYNGELYACGNFSVAGNIAANNIAKWNGNTWSDAGSQNSDIIKSLIVYNGELYAGGYFIFPNSPEGGTAIAKWNGTNWTAVGPQTDFYSVSIECMEVYNGELYAAGTYYLIGGGGVAEYYRISKWDGFNWTIVLTMPTTMTLDGALGAIFSMKAFNGELYVAGQFSALDTVWASQIGKWNGTTWSAVGSGINFDSYPYGIDGSYYTFVKSLEVYNGCLYAAGFFTHCDTIVTRNIARWDGSNWSALAQGLNGYVYALKPADSFLYVGGRFNAVNGINVPANNIAKWGESCLSVPSQPTIIYGNDTACRNSQQAFFVNETPGNGSYTWILPAGWTGISTTNTIIASIGETGGVISVMANNSCGSSPAQTLDVTVTANAAIVIQDEIAGNNTPCEGSTQTYSISPLPNAIDYTWSLPQGWVGGSTGASITVTTGALSGVIAVKVIGECGSSIPKILSVAVATPPQRPDFIMGNKSICTGTSNLYYVQWPQPVTSYTWLLPAGWSGNSSSDSIIITPGSSDGIIEVSAYNSCGSSNYATLPVSVDSIPDQPGTIIGNIYVSTKEFNYYSINTVAGATAYNWLSPGATINAQNTSSISASWHQSGTYELMVQAVNRCGATAFKKIAVIVSDHSEDDPFDLEIYPIPSNGEFYLEAKRTQNKMIDMEIRTIAGQVIYRRRSTGSNDHLEFIDLKKMSQGIYAVRVIIDGKAYAKKIIIHK